MVPCLINPGIEDAKLRQYLAWVNRQAAKVASAATGGALHTKNRRRQGRSDHTQSGPAVSKRITRSQRRAAAESSS